MREKDITVNNRFKREEEIIKQNILELSVHLC